MTHGQVTTAECRGCGTEFTYERKPGAARKWCSERCRKNSYRQPCRECGVGFTNPRANGGGGRCADCAMKATVAHGHAIRDANMPKYRAAMDAWNAGAHWREVAAILGISDRTPKVTIGYIHRLHERYGLPMVPRGNGGRVYSAHQVERRALLISMWNAGAPAAEIAQALGWETSRVSSRISQLRARGVDLARRRPQRVAA